MSAVADQASVESIEVADLANPQHAKAIVYLLNEYAKDEMGGGTELAEYVKQNLVAELKKRHGIHIVLAFVNDNPAGLAICMEGFSTFACKPLLNIHDITVAPQYRSRGIAKRVLAKVESIAKQLGCCKLTLEVLEGNRIAQELYKSCGFEGYELSPEVGKALFWQKRIDLS